MKNYLKYLFVGGTENYREPNGGVPRKQRRLRKRTRTRLCFLWLLSIYRDSTTHSPQHAPLYLPILDLNIHEAKMDTKRRDYTIGSKWSDAREILTTMLNEPGKAKILEKSMSNVDRWSAKSTQITKRWAPHTGWASLRGQRLRTFSSGPQTSRGPVYRLKLYPSILHLRLRRLQWHAQSVRP